MSPDNWFSTVRNDGIGPLAPDHVLMAELKRTWTNLGLDHLSRE